ncbi:MAG: amidase, partial [Chloroflexi bacterium]|nr:amidase [Chloroflexota bacterium]
VDDSMLKLEEPGESFYLIFSTNVYAGLGHLLEERGDELTDYVREGMEFGRDITGADYARALGHRDRLIAQFADVFDEYDLILSPTMAVPAFPVGEAPAQIAGMDVDPFLGFIPFTYPINMIGNPAASVPCGFSSDGLPIGLHIIGRFGDEETVLAASAAFERVRPWIQHRPDLV